MSRFKHKPIENTRLLAEVLCFLGQAIEMREVVRPTDYHFHRCYKCKHIWSHDRLSAKFGNSTEEHTCVKCGEEQRIRFLPNEEERKDACEAYNQGKSVDDDVFNLNI